MIWSTAMLTFPPFRDLSKILHPYFHQISTVLVIKKNTKKLSENGDIYTAGKNFTLPPALTAWTNSTSSKVLPKSWMQKVINGLTQSRHSEQRIIQIKPGPTKLPKP